jgi:hypothetical protein
VIGLDSIQRKSVFHEWRGAFQEVRPLGHRLAAPVQPERGLAGPLREIARREGEASAAIHLNKVAAWSGLPSFRNERCDNAPRECRQDGDFDDHKQPRLPERGERWGDFANPVVPVGP